jgi:hypothetical protein
MPIEFSKSKIAFSTSLLCTTFLLHKESIDKSASTEQGGRVGKGYEILWFTFEGKCLSIFLIPCIALFFKNWKAQGGSRY